MQRLKLGDKIDSYTGVSVRAGVGDKGEKREYFAGSTSGYVLEVDNPFGSQAMANRILASLKARGVPYQPFTSTGTLFDPAADIGDSVSVRGNDATVWSIRTHHGALMAAEVAAPMDEEVNHEFNYKTRQTREFTRESAFTRARLSVMGDRITSEVTRLDGQNRELGSRIDQRLDSITLSVTSVGGSSTFTLRDGTTTLDTRTLDLTVEAVNVSGQLTASQIAAGSISVGHLTDTAQRKIQSDESQIYFAAPTGTLPTAPTAWVTDTTGNTNRWTQTRPQYSSSYPALYTATQRLNAKDEYSCSTPKPDTTVTGTTIIDGGNVITGRITASQIAVNDLSAFGATIGGWAITSERLQKETDTLRIRLNAFANPQPTYTAIGVATRATVNDTFSQTFYVRYDGKMYAQSAEIAGKITATSGVIGGITIDGNGDMYVGTDHVTPGINTNLGYGAAYGAATTDGTGNYPGVFTCGRLDLYGLIRTAGRTFGAQSITFTDGDGNVVTRTFMAAP